jgi:DNA-binding SARP family transcriptional activator
VAILRIRLFGTFELRLDQRPLPPFPTGKAKSLFCFLALHRGRMFSRAVLLGQFWKDDDESVGRRNLRTCLWRVRSVIEPQDVTAGAYIRVDGDNVGFHPTTEYWMDVEAFESSCADIQTALADRSGLSTTALQDLLSLYRSDLLDDLYDDWCVFERERQRFAFHATLERLATHLASRGEWQAALTPALLLLHRDPLREQVHRLVMRCHWRSGNRPAALLQYDTCLRLLRVELATAPMHETTALRNAILNESAEPPLADVSRVRAAAAAELGAVSISLRELEAAAAHLEHARVRLSAVTPHSRDSRDR